MRTETVSGGPRPADVSVLLAVRNGMPELSTCLKSLGRQTLAPERMEVIVVDDASTDASAEEADAFARGAGRSVTVLWREAAAAVPGLVRNQALARATGRYVLFLGSADRLGDEALERMLAAADRDDSDVVVGKVAGAAFAGSRSRRSRPSRARKGRAPRPCDTSGS